MVDRAHKPSALSPSTTGPQPTVHSDGKKVTASLPSGDSVEVMLYGATVTSWKNNGQENMWLSSNAHMDGSKAIRGGVPVVFPVRLHCSCPPPVTNTNHFITELRPCSQGPRYLSPSSTRFRSHLQLGVPWHHFVRVWQPEGQRRFHPP
jgi:hypothetical protein